MSQVAPQVSEANQIPEEKWIRFWTIIFREIDRIEAAAQKEKEEAVSCTLK